MEPVLNLALSEWSTVNVLERHFSKKEGYSILIPSSRQQKGFDLIVYNVFSKKAVTIQVKGSRTYVSQPPKRENTTRFKNYTWFNSFKITEGLADYYILFGLYVKTPKEPGEATRMKNKNWFDFMLLLFNEQEMIEFLGMLTQKTSNKKDTKFSFGFNDKKQIFLTRGAKEHVDYTDKLFNTRLDKIKKILNPNNKKFETKKRKIRQL